MAEKEVDFFVLGAPKSGTTAVAELLGSHPSIEMSRPKEPHFFDAHYENDLGPYLDRCFPDNAFNVLRGEATPSYLMVPWAVERIAYHYPNAKLIVCLRNPVDRAFSSWWMLYSRGLETLEFKQAIEQNKLQGDIFDDADAEATWSSQVNAIASGDTLPLRTYIETGDYYKHLSRLLKVFPRENLHVIFSEDLRGSREEVLSGLWSFLSVSSDITELKVKETMNAAYGKNAGKVLRLAKHLRLMRLRRFVPEALREPIKARLSKLGEAPKIEHEMRLQLIEHFRDSNLALEELLGVDLNKWR